MDLFVAGCAQGHPVCLEQVVELLHDVMTPDAIPAIHLKDEWCWITSVHTSAEHEQQPELRLFVVRQGMGRVLHAAATNRTGNSATIRSISSKIFAAIRNPRS